MQVAMAHAPPEQTDVPFGGVPQALPQPPQLFGSLERMTQVPLQKVKPELQLDPHCPLTHDPPAGQALPQVPQWFASVPMFVSQPLTGLPSQLAYPPLQAPTSQAPPEHVALALANEQTLPQPPQL